MAEGLLRHMAGDRYEVSSAGTHPAGVHPKTIEVLGELGIDAGEYASTGVDRYLNESFDCVVTVCDRAREACPVFPGARTLHWSFEDPSAAMGDVQVEKFREVRDLIKDRIRLFLEEESD